MFCDQQETVLLEITLLSNPLFLMVSVSEKTLPCTAKGTEPQGFQVLAIKLKYHGVFLLLDEP